MRTRLLPLVLSLSLVAVACGGGGDDAEGSADDSSITTTLPSTSDSNDASTSTTAVAVPLSPPTSRGPAPTLDVQPLNGVSAISVLSEEPAYSGVLGQLSADRNIVQAVALPPAPAAAGIAPLTGLPLDDAEIAARPAMVVKIDNTEKGRPQEALALADIVYVTEIEGGFTRLAAVFHSQTPVVLGPVRSGRTTDISVFSSFNTPVFVWSGANRVHSALLRRYDMVNLGAGTRDEYFRDSDRPGTYDLMTDPTVLWGIAASNDDGATPSPHFEYRSNATGLPPTAVPASSVRVGYASVSSEWDWDPSLAVWRRSQDGTPHVDAQDNEVRAANVLVAEVTKVSTGMIDTAGSAVREQQFIGSGRGWVFTDGHSIEVTWTKPSLSSVATWTTPDGIPVALTPGQTWVELAPGGGTTFG